MATSSGARIKDARKAAHLTQEQLAKKCGMATITIRQYENGKRQPRLEQLLSITKALGVSLEYLVDGVDENGDDAIQRAVKNALDFQIARDRMESKNLLRRIETSFQELNLEGQREAEKRVAELTYVPGYQRPGPEEIDNSD